MKKWFITKDKIKELLTTNKDEQDFLETKWWYRAFKVFSWFVIIFSTLVYFVNMFIIAPLAFIISWLIYATIRRVLIYVIYKEIIK